MSVVEAQRFRFPYQGDAATREKINAGLMEYQDMHLSHAGSLVRHGHYGKIDFALIEVTKINEDGTAVRPRRAATTTSTWSSPTRSSSR